MGGRWVEQNYTSNNFTLSGINYLIQSTGETPLFANNITNINTGKVSTYSFSNGSGTTSFLKLNINGNIKELDYSNFYTKEDIDGQNLLLGYIKYKGLEITEILKATTDCRLIHTMNITNVENTLNQFDSIQAIILLDTMLDDNDYIPIKSDGTRGSYISNDNLTLWNEPVTDLTQYVGDWWNKFHTVFIRFILK